MDLKEHFTEVVAKREELQKQFPDGAVYLTSIEKKQRRMVGGRISVANPHVASLMLVQETHRLSTASEVRAWIEEQNHKGAKLVQLQAKRDTKGQPTLGETVHELVQALQQANLNANPAPAPAPAAPVTSNLSAPPPGRQQGKPVQPPVGHAAPGSEAPQTAAQ